jgi:aspartyl/asparaginyl beta-hydroxylase (cupin superfamily)
MAAVYMWVLLAVGLFVLFLFEYERWRRRLPSIIKWYQKPLCVIGAVNTLYRLVSKDMPFMPMQYFPGHLGLEEKFLIIKEEVKELLDQEREIKEFGQVETYSKRISSHRWKSFFIKCYGSCLPCAQEFLPITSKLIEGIPEIHLAMLSILEPGAEIAPHYGPSKACYRYHLTISCSPCNKAFINIDGKDYFWKEGEGVLFDDTYRHYAKNPTNHIRIVLFCDVERKLPFPIKQLNKGLLKLVSRATPMRKMNSRASQPFSASPVDQ